jgi:gamma-glutamyl:cysteine ligase YbdK (ATP-grasp superfamily)
VLAAVREADAFPDRGNVPGWRIEENRWSAVRHGIEGELEDLRTGRMRPAREAIAELGVEPPARGWPELLREVGVADAPAFLADCFQRA